MYIVCTLTTGLGAFHAIQPENESALFYSSRGHTGLLSAKIQKSDDNGNVMSSLFSDQLMPFTWMA